VQPFIVRAGQTHTSNGVTITQTTATRQTVSGLPDQPTGLIVFAVCAGALNGPDAGQFQSSSFGVCSFPGGTPDQSCYATSSNATGSAISASHIATDDPSPADGSVAAWDYGGLTTNRGQAKVATVTADGFTIDYYNNTGASLLAPVQEYCLVVIPIYFETARVVRFNGLASAGTYNEAASLPESNRAGLFGLFDSSLNAWDGDAPFALGLVLGSTFQRSINIQVNSSTDDISVQFLTAFGSGEIRDTGANNSRTVDVSISSTQVTAVNTVSSTVRAPGMLGLVWSTAESMAAVDFDTPTSAGAANIASGLGFNPEWQLGVLTSRVGNDAAPALDDALYGLFANVSAGGAAVTFGMAGSGGGAPTHRTYAREGGAALTTGSGGQLLEATSATFGTGATGLDWSTVDATAYKGFALVGTSPLAAPADPGDATIANTVPDLTVSGEATQASPALAVIGSTVPNLSTVALDASEQAEEEQGSAVVGSTVPNLSTAVLDAAQIIPDPVRRASPRWRLDDIDGVPMGRKLPPRVVDGLEEITSILSQPENIVSMGGGGALLLRFRGQNIYRQAFGNFTTTTAVPLASATKFISAVCIAKAVADGDLSFQTTVGSEYVSTDLKEAITVQQVYSHTSGLNDSPQPQRNPQFVSIDACVDVILSDVDLLYGPPGNTLHYAGVGMQLAAGLLERNTGTDWQTYFAANVAAPLGMSSTDYLGYLSGVVSTDNPNTAGSGRSNIDDYAALLQMILDDGVHSGSQFLPRRIVRELVQSRSRNLPVSRTPYDSYVDVAPRVADFRTCMGAWVLDDSPPGNLPAFLNSGGAWGCQPFIDFKRQLVGVFLPFNTALDGDTQRNPASALFFGTLWPLIESIVPEVPR
jgi:CubicO group peptidase (beta-lactamase class C family)